MADARRAAGRRSRPRQHPPFRYTVDASVFVNAFNPHEDGHADSLAVLTSIQERADPVIVPALLIPEIASAVARASDDFSGAREYARATAGLPHLMLVSLASTMAREAAELAATYRLRGADAVYVAVARRYGTTLVTRDEEQRSRGSSIVTCQTPAEALSRREESAPARRRRPPPRL